MPLSKTSAALHFVHRSQLSKGSEDAIQASWVPNTDVYVCDQGLVVKVELAGIRREDLELTLDGNQLRISGNRPDGCRSPNCRFVVMEINYGPFESIVDLPEGYDPSRAKASYTNGFLRVDIPSRDFEPSQPGTGGSSSRKSKRGSQEP